MGRGGIKWIKTLRVFNKRLKRIYVEKQIFQRICVLVNRVSRATYMAVSILVADFAIVYVATTISHTTSCMLNSINIVANFEYVL